MARGSGTDGAASGEQQEAERQPTLRAQPPPVGVMPMGGPMGPGGLMGELARRQQEKLHVTSKATDDQ